MISCYTAFVAGTASSIESMFINPPVTRIYIYIHTYILYVYIVDTMTEIITNGNLRMTAKLVMKYFNPLVIK
jgi:hypothetical protein